MDTSGCFELVEMPDVPEGVRNIHFRVDDVEAVTAHLREQGLRPVRASPPARRRC
jgi:4-hydroxyphenylpyruvate dioxygenase-like putative hemolysin